LETCKIELSIPENPLFDVSHASMVFIWSMTGTFQPLAAIMAAILELHLWYCTSKIIADMNELLDPKNTNLDPTINILGQLLPEIWQNIDFWRPF